MVLRNKVYSNGTNFESKSFCSLTTFENTTLYSFNSNFSWNATSIFFIVEWVVAYRKVEQFLLWHFQILANRTSMMLMFETTFFKQTWFDGTTVYAAKHLVFAADIGESSIVENKCNIKSRDEMRRRRESLCIGKLNILWLLLSPFSIVQL